MKKRAAAYIRRSSVSEDSPGDVSRETQVSAVRALAQANEIDPDSLVVFEDWGKSADETKREKRTGYLALLGAIEGQTLDYVFVYHIDRIIRSVRDFVDLTRVADGHTTILTPQFPLTGNDPMGRAFTQIAAVFAELELNRIKERNRKALAVRIERGDALGQPTWGMMHTRNGGDHVVEIPDPDMAAQVQTVLEAVREAGTILGAVRLLNERGIPSPKGKVWHTSALTRIVKAHAPELVNGHRRKGRPAGPAVLSGLVRCHCGQIMTPNAARRQLYCYKGNSQGVAVHGKAHVREADILPWIMNQSMEVHLEADLGQRRANLEQRQAELVEKRARLGEAFTDGLMTREQANAKAAEIDGELSQIADDLAAMGERPNTDLYELPEMDPATYKEMRFSEDMIWAIQRHLHGLMRAVKLDKKMRPVKVEWLGATEHSPTS